MIKFCASNRFASERNRKFSSLKPKTKERTDPINQRTTQKKKRYKSEHKHNQSTIFLLTNFFPTRIIKYVLKNFVSVQLRTDLRPDAHCNLSRAGVPSAGCDSLPSTGFSSTVGLEFRRRASPSAAREKAPALVYKKRLTLLLTKLWIKSTPKKTQLNSSLIFFGMLFCPNLSLKKRDGKIISLLIATPEPFT